MPASEDGLEVPAQYDPESYRAGYAQAMRHIGQTALAGAEGLQQGASVDERSTDDNSGEATEDTCPECGADTLASMGAPAGVTPAGRVCPACEM